MRKVTQQAIECLYKAEPFKQGNTKVKILPNVSILCLHNNEIAYLYNDPDRALSITNAAWQTNTTKERLNGLPNVSIVQKKGVWFLNGKKWDGTLIDIK